MKDLDKFFGQRQTIGGRHANIAIPDTGATQAVHFRTKDYYQCADRRLLLGSCILLHHFRFSRNHSQRRTLGHFGSRDHYIRDHIRSGKLKHLCILHSWTAQRNLHTLSRGARWYFRRPTKIRLGRKFNSNWQRIQHLYWREIQRNIETHWAALVNWNKTIKPQLNQRTGYDDDWLKILQASLYKYAGKWG